MITNFDNVHSFFCYDAKFLTTFLSRRERGFCFIFIICNDHGHFKKKTKNFKRQKLTILIIMFNSFFLSIQFCKLEKKEEIKNHCTSFLFRYKNIGEKQCNIILLFKAPLIVKSCVFVAIKMSQS